MRVISTGASKQASAYRWREEAETAGYGGGWAKRREEGREISIPPGGGREGSTASNLAQLKHMAPYASSFVREGERSPWGGPRNLQRERDDISSTRPLTLMYSSRLVSA